MVIRKLFRKYRLSLVVILLLLLCFGLYWGDNAIKTDYISIFSNKLPEAFEGFKILQISDLHNKEFGKDQAVLLRNIEKAEPDIIVVTGDLIDSRRTNIDKAMDFIRGAVKLAPVYYVTGNHEGLTEEYSELEQQLIQTGVILLKNKLIQLKYKGAAISMAGINDPVYEMVTGNYNGFSEKLILEEQLEGIKEGRTDRYTVLLAHRPEFIDTYAQYGIDLVFSGHAHGGQFRLPFIGGLIAPGQGLFPKYTSGKYNKKNTTEIVSRGLGNSIIPLRVFNRPQILVCTLYSGSSVR
ncbi:metallophosphoesterase [Clostridium sp. KNHs205]|uniref:metallophosphoesterase n=1 Tax=Clostridium sp. KNHs205 TaxID=1449050 RepID=UPI00051BBB96|nr:metallophosphoesterase [Clostridium sp. KNHs205]